MSVDKERRKKYF